MNASRVRLRAEIESMTPYRQGKPAAADAFKLSSNENPFEPIPAVLEAMLASSVNRYPDATALGLRTVLAKRFGIRPEELQVGAGSVAILAQLITAAAGHGDEVVYAWRSFEAYPNLVTVAGATSVQVPNTAEHRHDLPAMAAAITDRTRVVIVCSPNNPTGSAVLGDEFEAFMASVPSSVLVLLDEAYAEFETDERAVSGPTLLAAYPNLVVLRTFSKAYGLAGLRVGYAMGAEYLMDAARAAAIPLSVIEPAQRAAIASLEHEAELLERVAAITARRDAVWEALTEQGWTVPQPHGNFVWLATGAHTMDAAETFAAHGIVTRPFAGEGLRISIGESGSVDKLLTAAATVVQNLKVSGSETALD